MSDEDWKHAAWDRERAKYRDRLASGKSLQEARANKREDRAEVVGPYEGLTARIQQRMAQTACKGDRELVGNCFALTERECPEREAKSCPKRVAEFEARK